MYCLQTLIVCKLKCDFGLSLMCRNFWFIGSNLNNLCHFWQQFHYCYWRVYRKAGNTCTQCNSIFFYYVHKNVKVSFLVSNKKKRKYEQHSHVSNTTEKIERISIIMFGRKVCVRGKEKKTWRATEKNIYHSKLGEMTLSKAISFAIPLDQFD